MSKEREAGSESWRALYKAALFETDASKLRTLIAGAETAIVMRARALFNQQDDTIEERRALDAALNGLRVLKSYSQSRPAA